LDCDTIWIRKWSPKDLATLQENFGFCFGSMQAAPGSMCRGTTEQRVKFWRVHFFRSCQEESLLASPFRFPCLSPLLDDLVSFLEAMATGKQTWSGKYNVLMTFMVHFHNLVFLVCHAHIWYLFLHCCVC